MAVHMTTSGLFCVDQVYHLPAGADKMNMRDDPIFEDFIGNYDGNDACVSMIQHCIDEEIIDLSGMYIIVRLDVTLGHGSYPRMMWWGMVDIDDDMVSITPGQVGGSVSGPSVPRLTTWPPKN